MPNACKGLKALKLAGHTLLLWSARSNPAGWEDWRLNPLWRNGIVPFHEPTWQANRALNRARRDQMLQFVLRELPGVFDAVCSDGPAKPLGVDLFIDDKALQMVGAVGIDWYSIARVWGELTYEQDGPQKAV
jgi:hypothetical protein